MLRRNGPVVKSVESVLPVLDGTQLPLSEMGHSPQFSAHVLWPNGWIDQDALGMKVGLGPCHIVLHEDL